MKNQFPSISIITPSLNQGHYIEETINSVLNQNYQKLEYIIIDGGSTDNTLNILRKNSDRIKWVSQKDEGQTEAINKGLAMATGEIVSYINSDDILSKGTLKIIGNVFASDHEIQWIIGRSRIIDKESKEIRKSITWYKDLLLKTKSKNLLLITNYISQPAVFWRREIIKKTGTFDENLHYVMDYEYWLRLWKLYTPYFVDEVLAEFRIHGDSKTMKTNTSKDWSEEENMILHRYTHSRFYVLLHKLHRQLISTFYFVINK